MIVISINYHESSKVRRFVSKNKITNQDNHLRSSKQTDYPLTLSISYVSKSKRRESNRNDVGKESSGVVVAAV